MLEILIYMRPILLAGTRSELPYRGSDDRHFEQQPSLNTASQAAACRRRVWLAKDSGGRLVWPIQRDALGWGAWKVENSHAATAARDLTLLPAFYV